MFIRWEFQKQNLTKVSGWGEGLEHNTRLASSDSQLTITWPSNSVTDKEKKELLDSL